MSFKEHIFDIQMSDKERICIWKPNRKNFPLNVKYKRQIGEKN